MIQNRFIYNNIRSDTHGCGLSRIENKHSIQELSIACSLYIREHPAYESAPTSTHNVSLNLCATDNPNVAELRMEANGVGEGANRGAGPARTGVFHDMSLNVAKPPVKIQLSTHHNSLRRITRYRVAGREAPCVQPAGGEMSPAAAAQSDVPSRQYRT